MPCISISPVVHGAPSKSPSGADRFAASSTFRASLLRPPSPRCHLASPALPHHRPIAGHRCPRRTAPPPAFPASIGASWDPTHGAAASTSCTACSCLHANPSTELHLLRLLKLFYPRRRSVSTNSNTGHHTPSESGWFHLDPTWVSLQTRPPLPPNNSFSLTRQVPHARNRREFGASSAPPAMAMSHVFFGVRP